MASDLLLAIGLLLLIWAYVARLALGALDSIVPAFARMRRRAGRWALRAIAGPKAKRGYMFWLFVWLPALVTASLLAVVVTTGEGAVVLALGLVFTMASFWAWRTYERARRKRFQLPGRKRRRR
jgi:hypothetical protein